MGGRRLHSPPGRVIRPTSDRVREALFNSLGQRLDGLRVLDLFAGSGSLGIEAASRGAQFVVLVDQSEVSRSTIQKNLATCGLEASGRFIRWDLTREIPPRLLIPPGSFDLVFLDPPYALTNLAGTAMQRLAGGGLLTPQACLVVEAARQTSLIPLPDIFSTTQTRFYGDTKLIFYQYVEEK